MITNDYKIPGGIPAERLELHYNAAVFSGLLFFAGTTSSMNAQPRFPS
jgi:hypothetical protein